ncbi:MAG: atpG [Patescibacteria group bacterium]|jgi:ATP synthase F1 gamma subunit|nr:atpG [Patescibacteria group bacterium]
MQPIETIKENLSAIRGLAMVTEAFEQTAASAMRRTRSKIIESRPFFEETWKLYAILRQLVEEGPEVRDKDLVVIMTLNTGMAGTLLRSTMQVGERLCEEKQADLLITGRKGKARYKSKSTRSVHFFNLPNEVQYEQLEPLKEIVANYAAVHVVFPRYYGTYDQKVEVVSLVIRPEKKEEKNEYSKILARQYRIEPNIPEVVKYFTKEIAGSMIYGYFGEAQLAYNAAQMVAMRSARDNVKKEEKKLMSSYNRARREAVDVKMREVLRARAIKST